ncbi:MAG: 2-hydroxyacyl-CoA dehydratase subunit D [bacterium]
MDNQFDDKYKIPQDFSDNPANLKKQRFIEEEQIRTQSSRGPRVSNIKYFEDLMYNHDSPKKEKPRVGYFCNIIPQEIIMALGAEPVRLDCGNNAAALLGEEILSGEICPLAKASFGVFINKDSLANSCDLLILPTSCDAKRKLGEILNDIKPTFMLNLPPEQNHARYAKQSFFEISRLVKFLEKFSKKRLSRRSLERIMKLSQRRSLLVREIQKIRIGNPRCLSISDLFLIIQVSFSRIADLSEWNEEATKVRDEIRECIPERKSLRPRLILTGAPMNWPNFKILNLFEECGADIIADTLCTGAQACYDPVVIDERGKRSLLRALANKYIYASICPCFISQETRINRILDLIDETRADGVVNYSLRLCQLFDIENFRIERTIKSRKIPYINIRTDYSLEDTEQLRVRIEAFLETI